MHNEQVYPIQKTQFEIILLDHLEAVWSVALELVKNNMMEAENLIRDTVARVFSKKECFLAARDPFLWLRAALFSIFTDQPQIATV